MRRFLLVFFAILCIASTTSVIMADCSISVVQDQNADYAPTQIINGNFNTKPWMDYVLSGNTASSVTPNGVNGGWNTTEIQPWSNNLFEWSNNISTYNNNSGFDNTGHGYFLEMNVSNSAMLYQDLTTHGNDVILWTLDHAVRMTYSADVQSVRVEIGAPEYNGNNIVYASGINDAIEPHIQSATKVIYRSSGITNPSNATYGFNGANLEKLTLNRTLSSDNLGWHTVAGVYVIPPGQSVTRFGFIAEVESNPGGGNLMDNLSFSTLIGDLSATYGENGSVVVKGYWGETNSSKKLILQVGGETFEVTMTNVTGENFTLTIPGDCIDGNASSIAVYHEDYPAAEVALSINQHVEATAADVNVVYDGVSSWGISPVVTAPATGYTLKFGTTANNCTLASSPEYNEPGTYTIYYTISAPGYTTETKSATVFIDKMPFPSEVVITPPAGIEGLTYNKKNQTLISAGSATGGYEMVYALGADGNTAPTEGWSATLPKGCAKGDYYVWYKVSGDDYHHDSEPQCVVVNIAEPIMRTLTIDVQEPEMGTMQTFTVAYSNDFENGVPESSEGWTNDATYPWTMENGRLKSGNGGHHSTTSRLTVSRSGSAGVVSFHARVSSESYCDRGRFYIDNVQKFEISGSVEQDYSYEISAGDHTFRWEYYKDGSVNSGDDAFFIGDFSIKEQLSANATSFQVIKGEEVEFKAISSDDIWFPFVNWTDGSANILGTNKNLSLSVTQDITVTANFTRGFASFGEDIDGALSAGFSISATNMVYFSQGNLQYQASSDTYQFAAHQYDRIGSDNANVSPTYSGWIDLFCYGTGNNPTSTSMDNADFAIFTDWGTHPISNGGNVANLWRTLSREEWTYMLSNRPNASSLRNRGYVNGIRGLIILPDNWTLPNGLSFTSIYSSWESNTYTLEQWAQMEAAGAVFLPAAGCAWGGEYQHPESGFYSASTAANDGRAGGPAFGGDVQVDYLGNKYDARSVRLVTAANIPVAKDHAYNGSYQDLIYDPNGFEMEYKVNDGEWSTTMPQAKEVGAYTVTYRMVGETDETVLISTISAVPLTIRADNKSIAFGNAAPTYTTTNSGFRGSDGISSLSGSLTYTCAYSAGDAAGAYVIIPSGVSSNNYSITFEPGILTVAEPAGTSSAANGFSVSSSRKVEISSGNLQYQASTGTWRFAEHQYDCIGNAAGNTTSSGRDAQTDWIDLFGWGTSGYNSKYPYMNSTNTIDYPDVYNFSGETNQNYDWGYYNASQLGEGWRTLTEDEWYYLYSYRSNASSLRANASINGINGVIFMPDGWIADGVNLYVSYAPYSYNNLSVSEWAILEEQGCVFLPAAGYRSSATSVSYANSEGHYWASTGSSFSARYLCFYNGSIYTTSISKYYGSSVRLVKDIPMAQISTNPSAINGLAYNGSAQTLIHAGSATNGTMQYKLDNGEWSTELPQATNAGYYVVSYRAKGDDGYADYIPSSNTILLSIAKAPLTCTADNKSVTYGDAAPTYSASYSGWVNGETQAVLGGSLAFACDYSAGSDVDDYTITPSGVTATNYAITFNTGTLTVNKAPLTITADNKEIVYNEAAPAYTATYDGFVGEEDASVLSGTLALTCDYSAGDALGDYTITPSGLTSDNYAITWETGTLSVISPSAITLPDNEDKTALLTALNGSTLDITVGRTIVAGPYNTFCLPFSLSAEEIAAGPLAGSILKDYNGADVTGTGAERDLNIYLSDLTDITAGKPFLIKTESNIVNPTFTSVTISYTAAMGSMVEREHVDFQGILAPYDLAAYSNSSPDYLGIGMDGRLYWADASLSTAPMRGFRAFFHVKDAGAANSPVRRGMHAQFVEYSPKTPTGVDQITNDQSPITNKIIRDGHLIIIRGDKEYNANGMKMK